MPEGNTTYSHLHEFTGHPKSSNQKSNLEEYSQIQPPNNVNHSLQIWLIVIFFQFLFVMQSRDKKTLIYADLHHIRNEKKPAVPPPPSSHVIYSDIQQFQNVWQQFFIATNILNLSSTYVLLIAYKKG